MADIELVIKISEDSYKATCIGSMLPPDVENVVNAIKNGTPLTKGHERLNGADIIKDFKNKVKHYGKDYRFTQEEILNILERYEIKYAPTIIEEDKEQKVRTE